MTRNLKKQRRLWPFVVAVVAANSVCAYALVSTADQREAIAADQVSVRFDVPIAEQGGDDPEESGPSVPATPASSFVAALSEQGAGLFGDAVATATAASSSPTTPACMVWPEGAHVLSVTPTLPAGSGGVTVQILTTPTGAGTATVSAWKSALSSCDGAEAAGARRSAAPGDAPASFTASRTPAGRSPVLTQVVWSRGDTVAIVTYAPEGAQASAAAGNELESLRATVAAVDASLVAALSPVCLNLAPTAADSSRNPALAGYVQYTQPKTVPVPDVSKVAQPAAVKPAPAIALPQAREVPNLAPVAPLEPADWKDTNKDGKPDKAPSIHDAQRLPAPVLYDLADFSVTGMALDPGPAPKRPVSDLQPISYTVPVADPDGPGCGWAFNATPGPRDDEAALAAAGAKAHDAALVAASKARSRAWMTQLDWARQWSTWAQAEAAYAPVRNYLAARDAAADERTAAVTAYNDSVAAYEAAALTPPPAPEAPSKVPAPSPTPTPPPGTAPAPTPAPTPSPGPTTPPGTPAIPPVPTTPTPGGSL